MDNLIIDGAKLADLVTELATNFASYDACFSVESNVATIQVGQRTVCIKLKVIDADSCRSTEASAKMREAVTVTKVID